MAEVTVDRVLLKISSRADTECRRIEKDGRQLETEGRVAVVRGVERCSAEAAPLQTWAERVITLDWPQR